MANKNIEVITIPIAVLILSIIASAIFYLLSFVFTLLTKSNYNLGLPYFFKSIIVLFLIILAININHKSRKQNE
jgi:hypothetical protein